MRSALPHFLLAIATFATAELANAQCYRFASASDDTLDIKLTNVPRPTVTKEPGGMTTSTYDLSAISGNTVTLTIRGKTGSAVTFRDFRFVIRTGDDSTQVTIGIASPPNTDLILNAAIQLFKDGQRLLDGDALPKSFPRASEWTGKTIQTASLVSGAQRLTALLPPTEISSIDSCSSQ